MKGINEPKRIVQILAGAPKDEKLEKLTHTITFETGTARKYAVKTLNQYLEARAASENLAEDDHALADVQKIKKSPLYRDEEIHSANWFSKAATALMEMIRKLLDFHPKQQKPSDLNMAGLFGQWVIYAMWTILAALVALLAYLALRHASWKKRLKRKTSALLEEDEPERTLDEWLERADQLERAGQYREAVRCLYLACLLRFDEARVARFDRGQTNWEHLARIKASPLLPPGLDFEPTTKAFDQIWYGMRTKGKPDVDQFRDWYINVTDCLMRKAA